MGFTADAVTELQRGRGPDGWGYHPAAAASSEPSALAAIALAAVGVTAEATATADWLARIQKPDGSVGLSAARGEPPWPTALALLAWAAVDRNPTGRRKATEWLLLEKGRTFAFVPGDKGHDPTIVGWPWVENTHSWVEPTSLAMLALRRQNATDNDRWTDGLRLLRDRALPTRGGWNNGNTFAYGSELRPQPTPTGIALLALAGTQKSDAMIERACAYLEALLPETRAPMSLAWGILGLAAWSRRPEKADAWLAESLEQYRDKDSFHFHVALLLLATSAQSLPLLGVKT